MKNLVVRAFVLSLAVAGMTATTVSKASTTTKVAMSLPGGPTPVCAPSDPSHCGMD